MTSILLFDSEAATKPFWLELITSVLLPVISLIMVYCGYRWSFKNWEKQKQAELLIAANQNAQSAKIAACKAVWSMLAYMSEKENSKTVFVVRQDKKWHLRAAQAQEYIERVEEVFFAQGHGLFMTKEIRDDMYSFRTLVYRLLDAEKGANNGRLPDTPEILVQEKEIIIQKSQLFESLNKQIRQLLKMEQDSL
jgi:hypothetical protein